jgi:hypothetical protein
VSVDPRIAAEFGSGDDPIDEAAADVHLRAVAHLESLGLPLNEETYAMAVDVVAANAVAPVAPRDELERRLEAGNAIGSLAQARLGESLGAPTEEDYLAGVASVEEEFHLRYFDPDNV